MNAYLFTGITNRSQVRPVVGRGGASNTIQIWDASASQIIFSESPDQAQQRFEEWLRTTPEGENPAEVKIRKVSAAQFVDQLFTESGPAPLDWPKIFKQVAAQLESTAVDDFEQGYWADVDQIVRPEKLNISAGTLQSDVPEDIRSGLNWSGDKSFFFVLSVLTPYELQEPLDEPEEYDAETSRRDDEAPDLLAMNYLLTNFPEAADKEAAALIQARNSVVAAWLWRRYAANTRLASHRIRIDPWCCAMGLTGPDGQ